MTNATHDCTGCPVSAGTHKPADAVHTEIAEPGAPAVPEPWGACVGERIWIGKPPDHVHKLAAQEGAAIQWLYTEQQVRAILKRGFPVSNGETAWPPSSVSSAGWRLVPVAPVLRPLTDEQIDAAFERMPDGAQGFLKSWGYRQFAREIEALCAPQAALAATPAAPAAFQQRVQPWMAACFGPEISADRIERNHRFLEEALELVQANGCTQSEALQLVGYVFGRPVGELQQEAGGVMVTLAALCLASGLDMHAAGELHLDKGGGHPGKAGRQAEALAIARGRRSASSSA